MSPCTRWRGEDGAERELLCCMLDHSIAEFDGVRPEPRVHIHDVKEEMSDFSMKVKLNSEKARVKGAVHVEHDSWHRG